MPRQKGGLIVWKAPHIEAARRYYLFQGLQPRHILVELKQKFPDSNYTINQVHNLVRTSGWKPQREALNRDKAMLTARVTARERAEIMRKHAKGVEDAIKRFAQSSEDLADLAFNMGRNAKTPRDLSAAASAAKGFIAIFRESNGLDGLNKMPAGSFNFGFGAVKPIIEVEAELMEAEQTAHQVLGTQPDESKLNRLSEQEADAFFGKLGQVSQSQQGADETDSDGS